jgi:galactokinase
MEIAASVFEKLFHEEPAGVVRAPGRVNLIGEHTDYNDGFVLPMAIQKGTWIAFAPSNDRSVTLFSHNFNEKKVFDLDALENTKEGWIEYAKGVAWALREAGHAVNGWRGVVSSNIPLGSGLSSSAALEMGVARVFTAVGGYDLDASRLARIGQTAENQWVGMNCGIMDQLSSAAGKQGHAILIDCRSLAIEPVPLPPGFSIVIMDTGTRRRLVDSAYNERRAMCEAGARFFGKKALRDVTPQEFADRERMMEKTMRKRCKHVITENARTAEAAEVLRAGKADRFGQLMNQSHESLRLDFEVSSPALDTMVEIARRQPGCRGARMTGAGFGGCAVALVARDAASNFIETVQAQYHRHTKNSPSLFATQATDGVGLVGASAAHP